MRDETSRRISEVLKPVSPDALAAREAARALMAMAAEPLPEPTVTFGPAGVSLLWTVAQRVLVVHALANASLVVVAVGEEGPRVVHATATDTDAIEQWFAWLGGGMLPAPP